MRVVIAIILTLVCDSLVAQNPFWVATDKRNIKKVSENVDNPEELMKLFNPRIKDGMNNLGFDYHLITTALSGGYVSQRCHFYFYKDSLIAYAIYPRLPSEKKLKSKYLSLYGQGFTTDSLKVLPYYSNIEVMRSPLSQFVNRHSQDEEVRYYSSPESGISYGTKGGLPLSYLQNRANFIELERNLSRDNIIELMYSKNPASRLTAIEYYYKNMEQFLDVADQIDIWVEVVFKEHPYISTMSGCFVSTEKSRELVMFFSDLD